MYDRGKSDSPIVPAKPPNKPGKPGAEVVEGRGLPEGNTARQTRPGLRAGDGVSSELDRVRRTAGASGLDARTRGRSPVRSTRTLGSARGAAGNGGPHRDRQRGAYGQAVRVSEAGRSALGGRRPGRFRRTGRFRRAGCSPEGQISDRFGCITTHSRARKTRLGCSTAGGWGTTQTTKTGPRLGRSPGVLRSRDDFRASVTPRNVRRTS